MCFVIVVSLSLPLFCFDQNAFHTYLPHISTLGLFWSRLVLISDSIAVLACLLDIRRLLVVVVILVIIIIPNHCRRKESLFHFL
mmetsp:Transcript_2308/g.6814  ORF Transcript_2308/g.6814 Transcript_2308/m.6814 type:complete len:84 (-) Transcript_2308:20-271(-)